MMVWFLAETLVFCLLFIQNAGQQCDDATEGNCDAFTYHLAKVSEVKQYLTWGGGAATYTTTTQQYQTWTHAEYCQVLVKKPMTFHQASLVCAYAGGRLFHVADQKEVERLISFARLEGIHFSSSSDRAGLWATACSDTLTITSLKWISERKPTSAKIPYGAELILCSNLSSGYNGLCMKANPPVYCDRKLPFFCEIPFSSQIAGQEYLKEHETFFTVVMVVVGGLMIAVVLGLACAIYITREKKGDMTVEAAKGTEQGDTPATSAQGSQGVENDDVEGAVKGGTIEPPPSPLSPPSGSPAQKEDEPGAIEPPPSPLTFNDMSEADKNHED